MLRFSRQKPSDSAVSFDRTGSWYPFDSESMRDEKTQRSLVKRLEASTIEKRTEEMRESHLN
jgi:hypothetical protein